MSTNQTLQQLINTFASQKTLNLISQYPNESDEETYVPPELSDETSDSESCQELTEEEKNELLQELQDITQAHQSLMNCNTDPRI